MPVDVVMPQMGESIFEGTITKWLKKPGDKVERDEPLFEISTDKVDAEIPAPSAGVLKEIKVPEGKTVPIQTVVAVIDAVGAATSEPASAPAASPAPASPPQKAEAPKAAAPPAAAPQPPASNVSAPAQAAPAAPATPAPSAPNAPSAGSGNGKEVRSSPLVRRMAKENHVDLSGIEGSGAGGRISKKDILAAMESGSARRTAQAAAGTSAPAAPSARSSASQAIPPGPGGAVVHPALE